MLAHLNEDKEIKIYVDDPRVIDLVQELVGGKISQTELFNKLGRYKTKQALTEIEKLKLWAREQYQAEVDFCKFLFGKHDGREKLYYQLGENIEVQIKPGMAIFTIKGDLQ